MPTLRDSLTYNPSELTFGTSGLRGLVSDMTDLECYINSCGFLQFLVETQALQRGRTIYLAGDLRDSTPRIMRAVCQAITDGGFAVEYCGLIPTPAVAYYGLQRGGPCIMVTGSHIPADRNGIKFYKQGGEVLKADEAAIKQAVAAVRTQQYDMAAADSLFDGQGMVRQAPPLPAEKTEAREMYSQRYSEVFDNQTLAGKQIIFYQHSAVGRDILVEILRGLGAEVIPVDRSDVFVPIDSENVTAENQAYFRRLAAAHPDAWAIVSTDGDSDRPFVIDERGEFHRGDVLGAIVAEWLQADFAAFPVSASDAVDSYLTAKNVPWQHTRIGSPYVITAMAEGSASGKQRPVGWEVNGGFLLGTDVEIGRGTLKALPTRDALIAILGALIAATQQQISISTLFSQLPQRFTQAGLIDNFPLATSQLILSHFANDTPAVRTELQSYFTPEHGFGLITAINTLDGIRIYFDNGDIAHLRPSGNAPQLRIYSTAASQQRADAIVADAIAEDGVLRRLAVDRAE